MAEEPAIYYSGAAAELNTLKHTGGVLGKA